ERAAGRRDAGQECAPIDVPTAAHGRGTVPSSRTASPPVPASASLVQNEFAVEGHRPVKEAKGQAYGAAPPPKKLERVQTLNALYRHRAAWLRPSGCCGSSAGTSGCAGPSP